MSRVRSSWVKVATGLAVLAWGVAVSAAYYSSHKPFAPAQATAFVRLAPTLAGWAGTLVLAHALGRRLAPFVAREHARLRLALWCGLGFGALGVFVLVLGTVGGYNPLVAWTLVLVALPFGLRPFLQDLRAAIPGLPTGGSKRALALFVIITLALTLPFTLAPPTAWDALVYHLTGPKLYLAAGRIHHAIDLPYLGFPQWPAMLYTWAMLLGRASGAQLVHFTFALLTLALLPDLVNQAAPGRGWLAGALLLSAPAMALLASWAMAEWLTMFCVTAALVALLQWRQGKGGRWLALAGAFAGLSLAAKYTSAGSIVGLTAVVVVISHEARRLKPPPHQRVSQSPPAPAILVSPKGGLETSAAAAPISGRPALRATAIFSAVVLIVVLPWLAKNWALTGNPVYPFFFPGKFWDVYRAEWYSRAGTGLRWDGLIIAPWSLMVIGGRDEDIGPLFLALVPVLVIGWRAQPHERRAVLALTLAVCAIAYAGWLTGLAASALLAQSRLLFPIFPLLAVLAAAAFDGLSAIALPRLKTRWVVGGLIGLVLTLSASARLISFVSENPLPFLFGRQSEAEYLTDRLGMHYFAMEAANELPAGSHVVFLWEPRSYYCQAGCEPDALLDRWWHVRRTTGDAAAIARRWRGEGVTHVLVFQLGADAVRRAAFDPLTGEDWAELEKLEKEELTLALDLNGVYRLYALAPDK